MMLAGEEPMDFASSSEHGQESCHMVVSVSPKPWLHSKLPWAVNGMQYHRTTSCGHHTSERFVA